MKELDNIYIIYLDDKTISGIDHIKKKDNHVIKGWFENAVVQM